MEMLKKIIIAAIITAVVSLGFAGSIYAYQKEAAKQNPEKESFLSDGFGNRFLATENHNEDCQGDCECSEYEYNHEWKHNRQSQAKEDCEQERNMNEYKYSYDCQDGEAEHSGRGNDCQNEKTECFEDGQGRRNGRDK